MTTVIELIEMPNANEVRAIATVRAEEIRAEKERAEAIRAEKIRVATENDMINFIKFINNKIEKSKQNGGMGFFINIDNEYCQDNVYHDPRIDFIFKGNFNYKCAEKIKEIYSAFGFEVSAITICCTNGKAYRDGEVHISWWGDEM